MGALTFPSPSPRPSGEREPRQTGSRQSKRPGRQAALTGGLPLPAGEGRGEGEGSDRVSVRWFGRRESEGRRTVSPGVADCPHRFQRGSKGAADQPCAPTSQPGRSRCRTADAPRPQPLRASRSRSDAVALVILVAAADGDRPRSGRFISGGEILAPQRCSRRFNVTADWREPDLRSL